MTERQHIRMNRAGMIGLVCIVGLGVLMTGFGCWFMVEAQLTRTWDQVEGTIVTTHVKRRLVNRQSTARSFEYYIELRYRYRYQDQVLTGERFSLGSGSTVKSGFGDRQKAVAWLAESDYRQGSPVTVFVKPGEADNTVLSAGLNIGTVVPLILGLLFMSFALLFVIKVPVRETADASPS